AASTIRRRHNEAKKSPSLSGRGTKSREETRAECSRLVSRSRWAFGSPPFRDTFTFPVLLIKTHKRHRFCRKSRNNEASRRAAYRLAKHARLATMRPRTHAV